MSITTANTVDHSINTVNSIAQTQNPEPNLISQIFEISLHLAHFLISKEKLERNTRKSLRLYAVLDFCVSYLKEKNLSDCEKSKLDRLISLLIFKMPCNDALANRCDQIFSSFYPNPHSTSAKSLPNFIDIIQELKNAKMDTLALEIIDLYLLFLRNEEEIASENIFKVLDITKDYLTSFQTSLLPVPQETYNQFFDRHLAFLALYLKHPFKPESSLYERLGEILQTLKKTRNGDPDNPDFAQLLSHRAFLTSRPEWISYFNTWEAISCLKTIQNKPDFSESQIHIQLQIIYLKYEHFLRHIYTHSRLELNRDGIIIQSIINIQNVREQLLIDSLREIIKLQMTVKLSFSDRILASCLKASIQLQIAAQRKNDITSFKSALKLIEEILQEVESSGTPISRTTEEHVLKCKMDWVIHCIFAGGSKDYAKALTIINQWCSLPPSNPLFKVGREIKECIQNANETTPIQDAFTPQTISLIERFKQLILSDYQTFFSKSLEFYNREFPEHLAESAKVDPELPWTDCKLTIANLIRKNDIKSSEKKLNKIFYYLAFSSCNLYLENYSSTKSPFPIPFGTDRPTHKPIIQFGNSDVNLKIQNLFLDPQRLDDYIHQHSSHPALSLFLNQQVDYIISKEKVIIEIQTKDTSSSEIDYYRNKISVIQIIHNFIRAYFSELKKFEGQLIHCNTLFDAHQSFTQTLGLNSLLKGIFSKKIKSKTQKKHVFLYKHHLPSIECAEIILRNNFLRSTKFAIPLDDFYKETFDAVTIAIPITREAISSDGTKTYELAQILNGCYKFYHEIVKHLNPSLEELAKIRIMKIATELVYLNCLPTEIENPIQTTQFFKKIPNTLAELLAQYPLTENLSNYELIFFCIMKQKSYFLIQEQNIEAALKLYDELKTSVYNSNSKIKFGDLFLLSNMIGGDFKRDPLLNSSKLNNSNYLLTYYAKTNKLIQFEHNYNSPSPANSTKKEVLETTQNYLKRETEKEEKKLARTSSAPTTTADPMPIINLSVATTPPPAHPVQLINKKAYKILQRIFTQNNEEEKGPWKDRSYRSDTVILRTEALKQRH